MPGSAPHALFVHGMGRTSLSAWPLLRTLRRAGWRTTTFGYAVRRETFPAIVERLAATIGRLPPEAPLVLIGHSLGGVLLRAALADLAPERLAGVRRLFLLGSPVVPSRFARRLGTSRLFKRVTRDCGHLLGSADRMSGVPRPEVPTTAVIGIAGPRFEEGPFGLEANDGVVTLSEASAEWLEDQVQLPVWHTWMPASGRVARVILQRTG